VKLHSVMALVALWLLLFPQVAQSICDDSTSVSELGRTGIVAEKAFANLNAETLLTQASLARTQILPCVNGLLTKHDAASFHRLMAMEAFINGDYARTKKELHASLLLEPGYSFPDDVAGEGHPLLTLYNQAATMPDGEGEKIYPPPDGYVLVGGVRNAARYAQTPVIIQVFTAGDQLRETRYVQPGEASPNWSGNAFGLTAKDIGIDLDSLQRKPVLKDPKPWYVGAGVAGLTSGVFYGVAMHQKVQYKDPLTPDDQLAGLESRANGFGTASLISGGSAIVFTGLGIGFHMRFGQGHKPQLSPTTIPTMEDSTHD
jgi:hypothetical protein